MSRNILLTMRYDGAAYHGWQLQKNAVSVQQRVNEAIRNVFQEPVNVSGCSRTDTGVHALMFCCNFHTQKQIPASRIPAAVNSGLPRDIVVYDAREVPDDFHARFSCVGKEYLYKICVGAYRDPFYEDRAMFYPYALDEGLIENEIRSFLGTHDFSAFCSAGSAVRNKCRTVRSAEVFRDGDIVELRLSGDGFLYNMVRIIVGTLIGVNEGKIEKGSVPEIIASRDRSRAGVTAPAQGLYLSKVFYPEEGIS